VAPAVTHGADRAGVPGRDHRWSALLRYRHGPIHAFKERGRTLDEAFDDEYFRHIQWAHFASGGAGSWPCPGLYRITAWDTEAARRGVWQAACGGV